MSKENLIKKNCISHFAPHTSQKGITLIALVITIIVMTILLAVTINMVAGDEGVITKSKAESEKQQLTADIDNIAVAVAKEDLDLAMDDTRTERTVANIKTELEKKYGANVTVTKTATNEFKVVVNNDSNRRYKIKANGEVITWVDGATSTVAPTMTIAPTATPTPTPTPTAKTTATITYRVGVKTFYTEEVPLGTSASSLACFTEPEAYVTSRDAADDMVELVSDSNYYIGCGPYYESSLAFDSDGNGTLILLEETDVIDEDTGIYICPHYVDDWGGSNSNNSDILGVQKESTYTSLGLTPTEFLYYKNYYIFNQPTELSISRTTGLSGAESSSLGIYDNCHFSETSTETTMRGIGVSRNDNYQTIMVLYTDQQGNDLWTLYGIRCYCLVRDTEVLVEEEDEKTKKKRRKKKKVQDITYDDDLVVWDFDNGCFTTAKPLWMMKPQISYTYNLLKFSDGTELKTVFQHRIFNKEAGKFTYPMTDDTPIGTTTFNSQGQEVKLISKEIIEENVEYYNIITEYHMNVFGNGILTSCRLNNLYPIENMKFVKDDRKLLSKEDLKGIDEKYIKGLRLEEQPQDINRGSSIKFENSLKEYVTRLIKSAKPR